MEPVIKGMRDFYNDIAREFSDEWYNNDSLMPVWRHFLRYFGPNPRLLDVGCGAGYESMRLHRLGASVLGVDISEEAVGIARERNPDCAFYLMDFLALDRELGIFDGAVAVASLIHVDDAEMPLAFRSIREVLRPGGYFLMAVMEGRGLSPTRNLVERNGVKYDRRFYLHNRDSLDEAAGQTGFNFREEIALPEELLEYGWKCYVYQRN